MSVTEALKLLKEVCAVFRGTLQEHQLLQNALRVVEKECSKDLDVSEKKMET